MKSMEASTRYSREPSPDRPIAQPPRHRAACESCHLSKVKCTGGQPCARCGASKTECVYKLVSRIGKPKGSKNKTTIRRMQMEKEQTERLEAERAHSSSAQSLRHPETNDPQGWEYMMNSRNWPDDSNIPGGSFQPLQETNTATTGWAYGSQHLGTVGCQPSTMSVVPLERYADSSNMGTFDDIIPSSTSGHLTSRLPSLTSESSYTSSPWSGSAAALTNPSDDFSSPELFTIPPPQSFPAHSSCHCAERLASQLCSFRRPEALNSTTHSADGFLTNTDHLLISISAFLSCQTCEKNSMALSLMTTIFATFGQLFAALTGNLHRQGSPSNSSPNMVNSLNLSRNISFGNYHGEQESEGSVRAMLIGRTVHKWREACYKATRLLEHLQVRTQGTAFTFDRSGYSMQQDTIASGGEGTPLWGPTEIESFGRVVSRVDGELSAYV